ncbi:MAG: S-layer homology domain-containing protein, partial [Peptococcaceae bacterium]|nr:S-layer homology domain-containing protein [Peptococcaceae bacterium]
PAVSWGRGYLIVGVQQGMLDKDFLVQLRPTEVASRAEVAVLLYHALDLEDTTQPLTFADSSSIPSDYQSCVASVVSKGIMQGMPGNVFMPNEAVNRGQMAAMLSRVLAQNYGDKDIQSRRYSGICTYISQADQASWLITLNNSIDRLTTPGCEVFLDGRSTTMNRVEVGHRVNMIVGRDGLIVFVRAGTTDDIPIQNTNQTPNTSGTTGTEYKGRFDNVREVANVTWFTLATVGGGAVSRQIDPNLQVDDFGVKKGLSSLSRGDFIQIRVRDDKIIEVKTMDTDTLKGVVKSVRTNSFTISQDDGSDYVLEVSSNVQVVKGGANTEYSELNVDNRVQVIALDGVAVRIDIIASPSLQGVIREVTNTFITIREDNGSSRDYMVISDVEIVQGGSKLRMSNLREGDRVRVELNNNNRVSFIELVDGYDNVNKLTGEIWDMETSGNMRITIRNDNRLLTEYVVDRDVEVRRNNTFMNFNRLSIGDRVKLELDSRDRVNYIEVVANDSEIERGTIVDLTVGSNPQLIVERNNGGRNRYDISDNATIRHENGDNLRLRDLVIGSLVEVSLEYGQVRRIDVVDSSNIIIEGTLTYVYTNNNRVSIRQLSGNEFTYTLTENAVIRDDSNRSISLRDVREGWKVTLNLSGGRVTRLTCN